MSVVARDVDGSLVDPSSVHVSLAGTAGETAIGAQTHAAKVSVRKMGEPAMDTQPRRIGGAITDR